MRRNPLTIKKAIIEALQHGPLPPSDLETKVRTGSKTIANQLAELEYFGIITIHQLPKSTHNGRPYQVVELTQAGLTLAGNDPRRIC